MGRNKLEVNKWHNTIPLKYLIAIVQNLKRKHLKTLSMQNLKENMLSLKNVH